MPVEVVVLGMHRSGTSMVTRIINLLGLSIGPDDRLLSPKPDNEKGFWENLDIAQINDDLFLQLGGRWDWPTYLPMDWAESHDLESLRSRARAAVDGLGRDPAVVKDPRLSVTLPLWQTIAAIPKAVLAIRHPVEVAESLARRNHIPMEKACELWLHYVGNAVANAPDGLIVDYQTLLEDPLTGAERLRAWLGLPDLGPDVAAEIFAFADPSLRHHAAGASEGNATSELATWVYERLKVVDTVDALPRFDRSVIDGTVAVIQRPLAEAQVDETSNLLAHQLAEATAGLKIMTEQYHASTKELHEVRTILTQQYDEAAEEVVQVRETLTAQNADLTSKLVRTQKAFRDIEERLKKLQSNVDRVTGDLTQTREATQKEMRELERRAHDSGQLLRDTEAQLEALRSRRAVRWFVR